MSPLPRTLDSVTKPAAWLDTGSELVSGPARTRDARVREVRLCCWDRSSGHRPRRLVVSPGEEIDQRRQHDQRGGETRGAPDGQQKSQTPDAAVVRDEKTTESGDGGEAIERYRHHGLRRDQRPTVRLRLQEADDDVQAILGGRSDDEGGSPHVGEIEGE